MNQDNKDGIAQAEHGIETVPAHVFLGGGYSNARDALAAAKRSGKS